MVRCVALAIVIVFALRAEAASDSMTNDTSPQTVLAAVEAFRADPLAAKKTGALKTILLSAVDCGTRVKYPQRFTPWMRSIVSSEMMALLSGAYTAGVVEHRLSNMGQHDSPLAGVRMAIHTYKQLRQLQLIPPIKTLEHWIELEEQGRLSVLDDP